MRLKIVGIILCLNLSSQSFARTIRTVDASEEKVVPINTAIGYSTVLQFNSKPLLAVLGDQDAFKLEYVGNSITLKPLLSHSRSNLFVFTVYEKFYFSLKTVPPADVDYVVKVSAAEKGYPVLMGSELGSPGPVPSAIHSRTLKKEAHWKGYWLKVLSMSRIEGASPARPVVVYEFEVSSKLKPYSFSAAALGVKQAGQFLPIESLYLESTELKPKEMPQHGKVVLLLEDLKLSTPLSLIFAIPEHQLQILLPSIIKKGR